MKKRMMFFVLLVLMLGFVLAGCDNGTNPNSGGLFLTIINNYSNQITKVEMGTTNCTIDGLTALSETTSGPTVNREYEYTTPIASGTSTTFSLTADGGAEDPSVSVFVTADGLSYVWATGGLFGTSYNRHYTATLYPDGVLHGDFEDD
jgi:hypothetical protein